MVIEMLLNNKKNIVIEMHLVKKTTHIGSQLYPM